MDTHQRTPMNKSEEYEYQVEDAYHKRDFEYFYCIDMFGTDNDLWDEHNQENMNES